MSTKKDDAFMKSCLKGCLILLVIGIIVVVGGVLAFRHWAHQSAIADLSLEDQDELRRFFDEPLVVPTDWQNPPAFSDEVLDAGDDLMLTWDRIAPDENQSEWQQLIGILYDQGNLNDEQWQIVGAELEKYEPVFKALDRLLAASDYEMEAFPKNEPDNDLPDFIKVLNAEKIYGLQTHYNARQGEWEQALNSGLKIPRLMHRHPASYVFTHLIAITGNFFLSTSLFPAVQKCDDPALLEQTLDTLNELNSDVNQNILNYPLEVDLIAEIRKMNREGEMIEWNSGKPAIEYARQYQTVMNYPDTEMAAFPDFIRTPLAKRFYAMQLFDTYSAKTKEDTAKVHYDLLRLSIVQRLGQLKAEVPASTTKDWLDPFSGKPYCFNEQQQTYYSIGPDRIDNTLSISYDPTNGTISDGDIWLGRGD